MLNHILMMVMQLIQHQAMRNSIGFSPSSVVCSIYFFHDRARGCLSIFPRVVKNLLISYVLAQARPTMIYIH